MTAVFRSSRPNPAWHSEDSDFDDPSAASVAASTVVPRNGSHAPAARVLNADLVRESLQAAGLKSGLE